MDKVLFDRREVARDLRFALVDQRVGPDLIRHVRGPSSVSLRTRIDPTTWQTGRTFRYSGLCRTMTFEENSMSKRARKRRDRKKTGPNHGKRPNA